MFLGSTEGDCQMLLALSNTAGFQSATECDLRREVVVHDAPKSKPIVPRAAEVGDLDIGTAVHYSLGPFKELFLELGFRRPSRYRVSGRA